MSQLCLFPDEKNNPKPRSVAHEMKRWAEASYHYRRQSSLGISYSHPSMPWWDELTAEEQEESKKMWPRDSQ